MKYKKYSIGILAVFNTLLFATEKTQEKITSQEVFGYLERGLSPAQQLPDDIKYRIARYFSYTDRTNPQLPIPIDYVDKKDDSLFINFKVQSLEQFISPDTIGIKASFVTSDKLMLIMRKTGDGILDFNQPCDITLVDVATLESRKLAENFRIKSGSKNPHLFIKDGQILLFVGEDFYGNKCYNLVSGEVNELPGCKIEGFTENQEYLLLNDFKKGHLLFLNPQTCALDASKTVPLASSLKMAYHPSEKCIAYVSDKRDSVIYLKGREMLDFFPKREDDYDNVVSINFNKQGNLLAFRTSHRLDVWDKEHAKWLCNERLQDVPLRAKHLVKFLDNSLLLLNNGIVVTVDNKFEQLKDSSLEGLRHKTNKEGLVAFTKFGQRADQYLAEYIPCKPSEEDISRLTLKQRHFIELLSALELTYRDKVNELKKQDPAKNNNIVRINTLLSKIPGRIKGFTHQDIQQTWQSLAHMQTYLKKRFNVIE